MFKVFGIHREKEKEKWLAKNAQEEDESDRNYKARCKAALDNMRGKCLDDFDIKETAEDLILRLKKIGYTNLTIKIEKLVATGKKKRPVSKTHIDVSQLATLDPYEQASLRARL